MDAMEWIAFWAALFLVTHLVIASATVRPMLVAAVGEQAYRGIYSLAAFATLGPPAGNYRPATFGLHARTKSVGL